jgi:hypothetical protein
VHGGRRLVFHPDDDEKPGFPFNQDRRAGLAFQENPGFLAGRPFMPFFAAPVQGATGLSVALQD